MNVYRLILYVFFSAYVGGSLEYGHGLGLNGKDKINQKSSLQTLDLMEKIKEQLSSTDEYNELESFNDVLDNIAVADHDYKVKEMMEESLLLVANLSNVEKSTRFKTSVTPLPSSFRLTAETVPVYMSTAANNMQTTDGYYADRSETNEVYRPTYTPSTNNTSSTSVNLITEVLDSFITKNYMHITDAELNLLNELLQKITVSEGKFRTNNFELIAEIVHTIVSLKNKDNFSRNDEAETTNLQNIESLTNILKFLYQSNVEFSKGEIDRLKWLIKDIDDSFDTFEVFSNIKDLENAMNLTNNSKPTFKEVSQSQDYKKQVKSIFTPAVTKSAQETENTQVETLKDNLNIQTTRERYTNKHILENNSVNALQSHSKTFLDKSLLDLLYSSNIQNEDFVKLDLEIFLAKNFNISASDKGVRWLINNMKTVLNFNNDVMNLTNNNTAKEGSHLPDYQIQVKTTFTPVVTKYTQELTKLEENTEKENPNIQTTTEHPFLENETVDILQPNPKIPNGKNLLDIFPSSNFTNEDFVKLDLDIFLANIFNISVSKEDIMWLIGNMTTVLNVTHDVKNLGNIAEVFNLNDYQTKAKAQFKPEATKSADAKGQTKSSENAQVDILNNNPFIRTTTEQSEKEILKNNTVNIVQAHRVITNESLLDINHSQDYRAKSTFTAPTNAAKYNTLKERTMPEEDYHGVISKAELTTYQYKKDRLKNNTVDGNTLHNFINSSNLEHKESTKLGLDIFLAKNFNISISTDDIMSLIYNMTTNVNNDAIDLADYENLYELFLKDYQTSTSISTTKATKPDTPEILRTPGENLNELSLKDYQTSTSILTTEATKHDTLERLKTLGENLDELSLKEHKTSTPISTTKATKPDTLERLRTPGENLDELSLKEHQTSTSISTTKETKPDTLERLRTPGKNLDESTLKDYQTSISISTTEATKPDTMEILRTPGKNLDELPLKQYQTSTWEATKPDTLERLRTPGENRQVVMSTVNLNGQALIQQFETNLLENYTVNTMQTNTEILNSFLNIINSSITKNKHVTNLDLDLFLAKNFSMAASGEKVRNLIDTLTNVLNVTKHGRSKEVGDHTKTKLTIKEFTAVTTNEVQFQSDNRNAEENDSLPYKITASKTSTTQSSDLSDVSSRTLANIASNNTFDTMKTQLDYNMRGSDDRLSTHSDVLTTAETEPIFTTKTPYKWSEWASWQACSVTCGKGIKVATRECKLYIESLEVKSNLCKGNATKVDECVQSYCPLSKDHQTTASYEYFNSTNTTDWIINEMKKEKREIQVVDVIITIVVVFIALLIIFVTIRIRSIMMMDDKSDIEISRISKFSGKPKGLIKKHAQWLKEFGTSMKSKKQPQTDTTTKNINIDQFLKELDEVESDCSD